VVGRGAVETGAGQRTDCPLRASTAPVTAAALGHHTRQGLPRRPKVLELRGLRTHPLGRGVTRLHRQQAQPRLRHTRFAVHAVGVVQRGARHLQAAADAQHLPAGSRVPDGLHHAMGGQPGQVAADLLGAGQDDPLRAVQVGRATRPRQPHAGQLPQGLEFVEVADVRVGHHGDVQRLAFCRALPPGRARGVEQAVFCWGLSGPQPLAWKAGSPSRPARSCEQTLGNCAANQDVEREMLIGTGATGRDSRDPGLQQGAGRRRHAAHPGCGHPVHERRRGGAFTPRHHGGRPALHGDFAGRSHPSDRE
jgi:hypothetical protein